MPPSERLFENIGFGLLESENPSELPRRGSAKVAD